MKLSARYGVVAAMLALAGCSTTAQGPQSSTLMSQDLNFITTAYQLVHFDLSACAFVQKSTLEPQVVPVVNKICADAMEYAPRIRAQAAAANVTLPDTLPTELKAQLVTLNYRPQPNLSVAFIRAEISSHESALAVFQDEAQNGVNPTFKQTAAQTAPLVEQNLTMLRQALPSGMGE
jgi:putative membrane protein